MELEIVWSEEKNQQLIERYGINFERMLIALYEEDGLLFDRKHPNEKKYPRQRQLIIRIDNYAYVIPYVINGNEAFLKTLFPSRQATKQFLHHET